MTAKQFIKKYPNSDINENCLHDLACPKCGYRSQFSISSQCSFVMSDDGEDEHGDIFYDYNSDAQCIQCGHTAPLEDFNIDGLDDLLRQAADHDAEQTEAFNKYGMQV